MKFLSFLLLLCFLLSVAPAKADCPPWTSEQIQPAWYCGPGGPNYTGPFTCWQITYCLNPDGTLSKYGDAWFVVAGMYLQQFGFYPNEIEAEQYYSNWIAWITGH